MTRKYPNHTLQTNTCHHEEESHNTNSHKTSGVINVKQLALFPIDYYTTKEGSNTESPQTMESDYMKYIQQSGLITDVFYSLENQFVKVRFSSNCQA